MEDGRDHAEYLVDQTEYLVAHTEYLVDHSKYSLPKKVRIFQKATDF